MTKTLPYYHIIREPLVKIERPPVLFMIHGYGSNEQDLFSFSGELPKELFVISLRAPHDVPLGGYAWYSLSFDEYGVKSSDEKQAIDCRDGLMRFISQACDIYSLDSSRVSLLGFSQGAILGYAMALSFPEKVKNLVALSGYINLDIVDSKFSEKDFSMLNIYSSHGKDDQIIPLELANKTPTILNQLKIDQQFEIFPVGHALSMDGFISLKNWLSERL